MAIDSTAFYLQSMNPFQQSNGGSKAYTQAYSLPSMDRVVAFPKELAATKEEQTYKSPVSPSAVLELSSTAQIMMTQGFDANVLTSPL